MNAVENQSKVVSEEEIVEPPTEAISDAESSINDDTEHTAPIQSEPKKERKSIFEKWADKLKDFLDNAE